MKSQTIKKYVSYLIKVLVIIIVIFFVIVAGVLIFGTVTDYQPAIEEPVEIKINDFNIDVDQTELSFLTWNIGYCGLGKEMDFFYEGGRQVSPLLINYQKYLKGVFDFVAGQDTVDFILLQEVDVNAKRSYYTNQKEVLYKALDKYTYCFAKNYDVKFLPIPVFSPMGKVESGIMNLNRYKPIESLRHGFMVNYSWPKRIYFPDRCFILSRFKLKNNKNLVIINIHNSPFEDAEELRQMELCVIKAKALEEYCNGNYVVIGGDWNQNPPDFNKFSFLDNEIQKLSITSIDKSFLPKDWQWVYDSGYPTNRDVNTPYVKGKTNTTITDFYVVSPNINVISVLTFSTGFKYSDHQPVYMRIKLIEDSTLIKKPTNLIEK